MRPLLRIHDALVLVSEPVDPEPSDRFKDVNALEARALEGDRTAWGALIERFDPLLQSALRGKGLPEERAKEIAQDTWIRLMAQQQKGVLKTLRLPALALAQAAFLALHAARDIRRRREDNVIPIDVRDPSPSAEVRFLSRQQLEQAETVLASLPSRHQAVFRRVYFDPEVPHAHVATEVGLSVQRVRQILWEVRSAMRKVLEDDRG